MFSRLLDFLTSPRYRLAHGAVIATALLLHLATHYATYLPALRSTFGSLPYFRLHVLHEAEFLLIVAYAGVVFGVRGGLIAIAVTGITSIPFVLTPYIFDREPRPNEIRDLVLQVGVVMLLGYLIVMLFNAEAKRREALKAAQSLQEADQMRSNFLSIVAHELRNPITAVQGYSQLLMNRANASDAERREWVSRIHDVSNRLNALVGDLLDISRMEAQPSGLRREPVAIAPLVSQALAYAAVSTDRHQLQNAVPYSMPPVAGDQNKIMQVLVNLITNAVKYSPRGGQVTVGADYDSDLGQVTISITDQGIGIPAEEQGHLFNSFHRVRTPETAEIPGSGLGLYIVKSLLEQMDGEIALISQVGKGSTFSVRLPVWREPEPQTLTEATLA